MAENFLPDDKLPEAWKDEVRINVLFAPFRDKSVNSKDWDTKLEFWKNLIFSYCTHNRVYSFTLPELSKVFMRKGRSPACLNDVIEQMYKENEIKPIEVFLQKPSETWSGWATDIFFKKPVMWSFTKIKDIVVTRSDSIYYVHIKAVESEAHKLLSNIPADMKSKLIDVKSLGESLNFQKTEQLKFLLHFLYCNGKVSLKTIQNKKNCITLVKFHETDKSSGISDKDVDIYTLEQSEKTLLEDVGKLEQQVVKLRDDAKVYLGKNQRQSAKSCLRKKKEVERTIEKRANALQNIQTLLSRLQDAHTDAQILDSYKAALSNLRTTFSETGLTEESVSNTMIDLEEVLEIHDGIQASLAQQDTTVDSDIENELAELLAMDKSAESATEEEKKADVSVDDIEKILSKLDINLPSPPKDDPGKTKISL